MPSASHTPLLLGGNTLAGCTLTIAINIVGDLLHLRKLLLHATETDIFGSIPGLADATVPQHVTQAYACPVAVG